MPEYKAKIHEILNTYLKDYIPVQEITHTATKICDTVNVDGTYSEQTIIDMHSYLQAPDKEYYTLQTVNTKSLTNNQIALAMHEIRKYLAAYAAAYVPEP